MNSHHGSANEDLMRRFLQQTEGKADRRYSAGRIAADDDGDLAYAITTDMKHRTIVIRYGKPVEWVGLGIKEAEELRDNLTERLHELGITTR